MAYESKDMRLMGGVPGQQLFLYRSADGAAAQAAEGYFSQAAEEYNLDTGDLILAVSALGGAQAVTLYTARRDAGVVTTMAAGA